MSFESFEKPMYAFYSHRMYEQFGHRSPHRRCCVDGKWRRYTSLLEVVYDKEGKIDMRYPRQHIIESAYEDLMFVGLTQKIFY